MLLNTAEGSVHVDPLKPGWGPSAVLLTLQAHLGVALGA